MSEHLGPAIAGVGASPFVIAIPAMAIVGGCPLWVSVLAVLWAVVALAWIARMIRKALGERPR